MNSALEVFILRHFLTYLIAFDVQSAEMHHYATFFEKKILYR